MARGCIRKAFYLALILLGVSLLCFALLHLSGRDPALAIALRAQNVSEENLARLREELGLTGTPVQQYFRWLSGFLRRAARGMKKPEEVSSFRGESTTCTCSPGRKRRLRV